MTSIGPLAISQANPQWNVIEIYVVCKHHWVYATCVQNLNCQENKALNRSNMIKQRKNIERYSKSLKLEQPRGDPHEYQVNPDWKQLRLSCRVSCSEENMLVGLGRQNVHFDPSWFLLIHPDHPYIILISSSCSNWKSVKIWEPWWITQLDRPFSPPKPKEMRFKPFWGSEKRSKTQIQTYKKTDQNQTT